MSEAEARWFARPYRPEEFPAVGALVRTNLSGVDAADEAYLRWQYEGNPAGPAHIWVAEDPASRSLVGQYAVVPMRLALDGDERMGGLAVNILTDRRYRGRGIFTELARNLSAALPKLGIVLTYVFPNPRSHRAFMQRLGFRDLGQVPLMVKLMQPRQPARSRFGPLVGSVLGAAAGFLQPMLWPRTKPLRGSSIHVSRLTAVGTEFNAFWARQRLRRRLMVVRDARYLQWRYLRCPTRSYVLLAAVSSGAIVGYLVGRIAEVLGLRAGLIIDLFVGTEAPGFQVSQGLIATWEDHCSSERVEMLAALMLPETIEARALRNSRYWTVPRCLMPQPTPVAVREHLPGIPPLGLDDWFLAFGDYDVL